MLTPCLRRRRREQSGYVQLVDKTKQNMRSPYVMRPRPRDKMPHLTHQICRTRLIETSFECHHLTRRENLVLRKPGVTRRLLVTEICWRVALGLLASCSLTVPGPPMEWIEGGVRSQLAGEEGQRGSRPLRRREIPPPLDRADSQATKEPAQLPLQLWMHQGCRSFLSSPGAEVALTDAAERKQIRPSAGCCIAHRKSVRMIRSRTADR